jgi:hypothetical protein
MSTPNTPRASERPQLVTLVSPWGRKRRCSVEAADIKALEALGWVVLPLAGLSK